MADNYYKELGLDQDATEDDIKKAYRKLAMAYHPDRTKGDKKKEEKFKNISVAYSTLSDPQKKKEYDQQQAYQNGQFAGGNNSGFNYSHGFSGAVPPHMDDVFREFFNQRSNMGGFSSFAEQEYEAPPQKVIKIKLTFWESVMGVKKSFNTTFTYASGKKAQEDFEVNIPSGASEGDVYHIKTKNGQQFSLVIEAPIKSEDGLYRREDNNLYTFVEIPITVAITGGKFTYSHWDSDLELKIPAGAQSGQVLRLKSKGVKGEPRFGDLFIELKVKTPTHLTSEQKELFEKLAATFEKKDYFEKISTSWQAKK